MCFWRAECEKVMSSEAGKEAGARCHVGKVTLPSLKAEGGHRQRWGGREADSWGYTVYIAMVMLSLSPHRQSLREKIEARKHWLTQRDQGRAGLRYLCPELPDCFPARGG